ncbi:hypothetical protein A6R68_17094 [Neotoma lepida]|uniref:Uncharacterized protein n=1 Tax=Neotoma lepida TaxID=56216 RepID=A0A1A6HDU1_NEOLE|nr:hypothetical protein A6R68_17094 [Neotoma lepida]
MPTDAEHTGSAPSDIIQLKGEASKGSTTYRGAVKAEQFLGLNSGSGLQHICFLEHVEPLGRGSMAYCVWRELAQDFEQCLVHLICSSFKELPTASNKQCVT